MLCILADEYETEYYYKYSLCPETIHSFVKEFPLNERKFKFKKERKKDSRRREYLKTFSQEIEENKKRKKKGRMGLHSWGYIQWWKQLPKPTGMLVYATIGVLVQKFSYSYLWTYR